MSQLPEININLMRMSPFNKKDFKKYILIIKRLKDFYFVIEMVKQYKFQIKFSKKEKYYVNK